MVETHVHHVATLPCLFLGKRNWCKQEALRQPPVHHHPCWYYREGLEPIDPVIPSGEELGDVSAQCPRPCG